jgi:DHA2 family multidrug resistance protein
MTGWTPDVSQSAIVWVEVVQGIGLGFLLVALSTVTLATLSAEQRTEGAGFYNLSRNIGSSAGTSVARVTGCRPASRRTAVQVITSRMSDSDH